MEITEKNQTETSKASSNGWTENEKKIIGGMVIPLIEMQKAYGRNLDLKLVLKGWEAFLSDKFSGEEVCYALKKYALEIGDDFPTPKNIYSILRPEKPAVTQTEFIYAQKQWALEEYSPFSDWGDIVKEYNAQEQQKRDVFVIESQEILSIISKSVKKIK